MIINKDILINCYRVIILQILYNIRVFHIDTTLNQHVLLIRFLQHENLKCKFRQCGTINGNVKVYSWEH